jgi:DNA-binding NarL/FixJ family response regulator
MEKQESIKEPKRKCLLIDDHASVISGVKRFFDEDDNFTAVECHTAEEALNAIKTGTPDILFLDHSLTPGGSEGINIADQIRLEFPDIEIYSTTSNPENVKHYEKRGIKHIDKGNVNEFKRIVTE